MMKRALKAYIDLTRAHFSFVWPLLFCSGLVLAFEAYGGFSWSLTIRAALIGLFGFEAGLVLNDYIDREIDKKDIEFDKLTKYWRPFGERPLPSGLIQPRAALTLFVILVAISSTLIATLPYPNRLYVFAIMVYSYFAEFFYQVGKREQTSPLAQLVGRTDLSLFPVAGYLCYGLPDKTALSYFLFFYPWTMAHLGLNDLIDIRNDEARNMKTVTAMYGTRGTAYWILSFTLLHLGIAPLFLMELGSIALNGFLTAFCLLVIANCMVMRQKDSQSGLRALPLFHLTMMIYATAIILDYAF
jgi:4-hydroxybenzoate polyprenyltransferase